MLWNDTWKVHDDIRTARSRFRPIPAGASNKDCVIAIEGRGGHEFHGPTLIVAAEAARQTLPEGPDFDPIYRLQSGNYYWWDGTVTTSDSTLGQRIPYYIAELYQVRASRVTVTAAS